MPTCENCGREVVVGARFCTGCGHRLLDRCVSCGTELPPGAQFCPTCGEPVVGPISPARPSATPSRPEERKLVTVLFSDVTGSTSIAESLDPEPLREVFDAYFTAMRQEIEMQGGTVEKFIGDAVVAVFGVPVAHEDDPTRALRAARGMLERLGEVNGGLERAHGLSLRIRIGVNTGEVLASPGAKPGEPLVTGDVVNTAARLQTAADPGAVLVADRTARAAKGFRFGDEMKLSLRGKEEPVVARPLLGVGDAGDRETSGIWAPMVGRERELRLLTTVFDGVVDEQRPHLVTIYGDPGVGKSRLAREFLMLVGGRADGPEMLVGRCLPYGSGVTYWPLAEILKAKTGIKDSHPPDEVLARLEDLHRVGPEAIDAVKMRSGFAATLGLDDPRRPIADRDPKQVRREIHDAWRWFLASLAARRPVILAIEDIHWADDALLDLLEELADRIGGPVLFVCPSRPELTELRPTWGGGQRQASSTVLEPLASPEAERLVHLLLDIEALPPSIERTILQRAEGNPFFLEEIIRHMIDDGAIERAGHRWRAASQVADVHIPDTVQGVLAARIDLLDPADKRVLQLAAVVGRVFWPGSVGAQLDDDSEIVDALERLRSRDLVLARVGSSVTGEPEYIFKHVLTRDVAYETLPRRDRAKAHATVAAWIEEVAGGRAREFGELLAHHYVAAYDAERSSPHASPDRAEELRRRAFESLLQAADSVRARAAIHHALELVDRALSITADPIERARALESRGLAALSDYRGDDAWTAFREAVDIRLEATPEDRDAIAYACARAVESPMRWPGSMRDWPSDDVVLRYLEIGKQHAREEPSETLVRLLMAESFQPFGLMTTRRSVEDRAAHDRAVAAGLRAADLALSIGRPDLASAALDGATSAPIDLGLYGQVRDTTSRRLALVPLIEDPWELGDIYAMAAWTNMMLGDPRTALRWAEQGIALIDERSAEGVALHCVSWAAFAEFQLGAWDTVLDRAATCERMLGDRADAPPYFTAHAFCAAAMVHRVREEQTQFDRLRPVLSSLLGEFSTHHFQGAARAWMASIAIREGRHEDAEELLGAARASATNTPRPFVEIVTADLLATAERWAEVPSHLERARAYASQAGLLALPHHLDRLEGRWAATLDDRDRAATLLAQAAEGLSALEQPWEAARYHLELAEILAQAGRSEEARRVLGVAWPVFTRLGSRAEIGRCDALDATLG